MPTTSQREGRLNGRLTSPRVQDSLAFAGLWLLFALILVPVGARPDTQGGTFGFDFRDTFWVPIRDLFAGNVPWDVSGYASRHPTSQICPLYLPSYWLTSAPFMYIPYPIVLTAWLGFIAAMVVVLVRFSVSPLKTASPGVRTAVFAALIVFVAVTPPVKSGILAANWAVACAVGAMLALATRQHRWITVFLTCCAIVKPQVGLPLLALQLATKRYRTPLVAWAISLALAVPIGVLVVMHSHGVSGAVEAFRGTLAKGDNMPLTSPDSTRLDLIGSLGHLGLAAPLLEVPWLLVIVSATIGMATLSYRRLGTANPWYLMLAGYSVSLILPNLLYGATALVPGLMALAVAIARRAFPSRTDLVLAVVTVALTLVPFANFQFLAGRLGYSIATLNGSNGIALNAAALVAAVATVRACRAVGNDETAQSAIAS